MNQSNDTTAIYPNRLQDKEELESKLGLPEHGKDDIALWVADGVQLTSGYTRIVYGDHGPYIEFEKRHLVATLKSKYNDVVDYDHLPRLDNLHYYFWLYPEGYPDVKVYLQIKPVHDLPNAPKRADKKKSRFNRKEG